MDLLLWRWSVGVQWTSLAMITAFFFVLERSHRLRELRPWVVAWAANLVALGITVLYWNWYPTGAAFRAIAAGYLGTKVAFAILLIVGAVQLRGLGAQAIPARLLVLPIVLFAAGGLLVPSLEGLGLVACPALSVIFALGGILLLRAGGGFSWLAGAMLLRSTLFLVNTVAFVLTTSAPGASSELLSLARSFLAAHSFLDTGAEWVLALTSVLALSERVSSELRRSNRELVAAQDDGRGPADWDPLTALPSRRALPELLRHLPADGALLLFFELAPSPEPIDGADTASADDYRRRFASNLRDCFRRGDSLVRYAGDEFVVVAPSLDAREAEQRVKRLRSSLRTQDGSDGEPRFTVGTARLEGGVGLEAALEAADRAMDDAKAARAL